MDCDKICKHLGIAATLSKLSGFWVHKSTQRIKPVISSCRLYKKYNTISFTYPKVTNLPKHRVNFVRPFLHIGTDFIGHLSIQVEGERRKMYILLFPCLNIRAVHLELVNDMSTHSVALALVRLFNPYGVPSRIYTDNARAFVVGCKLVKQIFVSNEFVGKISTFNIKHLTIRHGLGAFGKDLLKRLSAVCVS